jgi:oligopeptide/dipeptide ABC transporter ATP-binding protein
MTHKPDTDGEQNPLIDVANLCVSFRARGFLGRLRYSIRAVNDVSFQIAQGKTFGLVGESGSGKSTIGRAILRLVDIDCGSIRFNGREVTSFGRRTPLAYRRNVQAVFQDPYSSLNPSHVAGDIIGEIITRHLKIKGSERQTMVVDLLKRVGLSNFHTERYPYELSGGQRQRVAIARALAANPSLIIFDEAVSSLDVSTQAQVINLLENLQKELGFSYLFIAHDLDVVRYISHTIGVLTLGRLVESGPAERVYEKPAHPYTQMLLTSIPVPNPAEQRRRRSLRRRMATDCDPPSPVTPPSGCPFRTRCTLVMQVCSENMPAPTSVIGGGEVRCHLHTTGPKLRGQSVTQLFRNSIT